MNDIRPDVDLLARASQPAWRSYVPGHGGGRALRRRRIGEVSLLLIVRRGALLVVING